MNTVEVVSTGQVLITEISEQVIELQTPGTPLLVEVATAGPQGPPGPSGSLTGTLAGLTDVNVTAKVDHSILYYDSVSSAWKGDDINTILSITDGGNW